MAFKNSDLNVQDGATVSPDLVNSKTVGLVPDSSQIGQTAMSTRPPGYLAKNAESLPSSEAGNNASESKKEDEGEEFSATKISRRVIKPDGTVWYFVHWARAPYGQY